MLWIAVIGCVRVLELPVGPDGDTPPTDAVPTPDTVDTAVRPSVCVPSDTLGYALPSARWGLAALYASRRLDDRPDSALRLAPSFFLATGWQTTGFGCASYGPPWVDNAPGDTGCLGIREETVWLELCRLFPLDYDCEAYPGALAGDRPEADTLALAGFALAAHALLGRFGIDPDDWYAEATDPLAVERLTATMHFRGPWTGEVDDILDRCAGDVEACLDNDVRTHVSGLADKIEALDAAPCWNEPLAPEDVSAFVDGLAAARPARDWTGAEEAALAALAAHGGDGFATEAALVLDALDAASPMPLACPELELYTWYRLPCP